ncbi:MAG: helix-turn-helix domain-containing protein [Flavobacteriales bacterium]
MAGALFPVYICYMDPVAQRIAELIEEKGYSYSAFAEAIGIQRANVSHVLSGRNRPSLDLVQRILHRFPELDSDEFLLGEKKKEEAIGSGYSPIASPSGANKKIERIVICYDDGTFASYEADG